MFHCCFCDVVSQGHMMDLVAAAPGGPGPPAAMASSIVSPIAAMAEAAYEETWQRAQPVAATAPPAALNALQERRGIKCGPLDGSNGTML